MLPGMTLDQVRILHPGWTIDWLGLDLLCIGGPWRFIAADPDDADDEIGRREGTTTVEQLGRSVARPGY